MSAPGMRTHVALWAVAAVMAGGIAVGCAVDAPPAPELSPAEQQQQRDELAEVLMPPSTSSTPAPCAPFENVLRLNGCPAVLR